MADTGIGIKDENKEKVFDRFFQEQHAATTYVAAASDCISLKNT